MPTLRERLAERVSQEVPSWCEPFLAKWGKNSYGENNWRVVWGWDRIEPREIDGSTLFLPIYHLETDWQLDRWILERWILTPAPERDGRRGFYSFVHAMQTDKKVFMPLEPHYLELIVQIIEKGKDADFETRKAAIIEHMEQADKAEKSRQDSILQAAMDDVRLEIGLRPSRLDDVKLDYAVTPGGNGFGQMHGKPNFRRA